MYKETTVPITEGGNEYQPGKGINFTEIKAKSVTEKELYEKVENIVNNGALNDEEKKSHLEAIFRDLLENVPDSESLYDWTIDLISAGADKFGWDFHEHLMGIEKEWKQKLEDKGKATE